MKHNFVFAFEIHFGSTQERQYIPSEDMGDYEEYKKKKGPKKSGPLYPLNEEVVPPFPNFWTYFIFSFPGCIWRPTSPTAEATARLPEEGEEAQGVLRLCRLQRLLHARGQADPERAEQRPNCETQVSSCPST